MSKKKKAVITLFPFNIYKQIFHFFVLFVQKYRVLFCFIIYKQLYE